MLSYFFYDVCTIGRMRFSSNCQVSLAAEPLNTRISLFFCSKKKSLTKICSKKLSEIFSHSMSLHEKSIGI